MSTTPAEISKKLREIDNKRELYSQSIRSRVKPRAVDPEPFSGTVAGVDGGLVGSEFRGLYIGLTRAASVIMKFSQDKLMQTVYYPPYPDPDLFYHFNSDEEIKAVQLQMVEREVSLAREVLKNQDIDYLFLHGSILPHPSKQPEETSQSYKMYKKIVDIYIDLFNLSKQKKVPVIGVVEDSKSTAFIETLDGDADVLNTFDTILLHYILKEGEITSSFSIHNPISADFKKFENDLKTFYIKTTKYDHPIKVEFYDYGLDVTKIAQVLHSLSALRLDYGIPCVLIEADLRAKLSQDELRKVLNLLDSTNPVLFKKRRDSRPF